MQEHSTGNRAREKNGGRRDPTGRAGREAAAKTVRPAGVRTFRRPARSLASLLGSVRAKRILLCALCFFTALVIAGTQAFPGTYPFGIAFAASAGGGLAAVSAAIGGMLGSARIPATGGVWAAAILGLFAARCAVSVWLAGAPEQRYGQKQRRGRRSSALARISEGVRLLFREAEEDGSRGAPRSPASASPPDGKMNVGTVLRENVRVRLALSAAAALFAGAWSVVAGGYEYYDLFGAVFSLFAAPLCTYLFWAATERKMRSSPVREFGVYALLAVVTLSLHRISASVFSLPAVGSLAGVTGGGAALRRMVFDGGILFAFGAAMVVSKAAGIHRGALAGLFCGMTMTPSMAPAYPLAAVISAVLGSLPPGFSVAGAGFAAVTWAIFTGGIDGFAAMTPPVALGCAVLVPLFRYELIRLPASLFGTACASIGQRSGDAAAAEITAGEMRRRIEGLGRGLGSVSAVLGGMAERLSRPSRTEMLRIAEEGFGEACIRCRRRSVCLVSDPARFEPLLRAMAGELMKTGSLSAAAIPPNLASSCAEAGAILDGINRSAGDRIASLARGNRLATSAADWELAGELVRSAEKCGREASEADEALSKKLRRVLSWNNFAASTVTAYGKRRRHIYVGDVDLSATRMGGDDIRRLFESIAGVPLSQPEFELNGTVLSMRLHSVNRYSCRTGSFSCAASSVQRYYGGKRSCGADSGEERVGEEDRRAEEMRIEVSDSEPEAVSGDIVTDFEADGRYYMILSDGMGSGKEAALTSGMAASLLERLIRSGAELETALKMLNQIIRSTERECSATVDIAEIDLATGEARFVKSGAAPSFVLRDGSIFRLQSKTVPLGILRALDAEMIRFDVQPGDTVVMISDGAARSYEEAPWLLDLMSSDEVVLSGNERMAAMTVVSEAAMRGSRDDITCGIMRIAKAKTA